MVVFSLTRYTSHLAVHCSNKKLIDFDASNAPADRNHKMIGSLWLSLYFSPYASIFLTNELYEYCAWWLGSSYLCWLYASQPAIHSYGYYGQRSGPFGNWEPKRSTCTHTKTRSPKHHRMINMVSGYVRLQSHLTPNDGASCACATGRIEQRHVDC